MPDKYTATWLSHSSISTFKHCPRAYYLNNVYKDPRTGHKIALTSPPLALGSAVHEVLESLSVLPTDKRFQISLIERFQTAWQKVTGEKGGFTSPKSEATYKERGEEMLRRVMAHPGPLTSLAVKLKLDLPYYWLSEEDNLILCGKIDWLEYLKDDNAVRILDFKTGKREESSDSLQLPIYYLLAHNCQTREVVGARYWYLALEDAPRELPLPDPEKAKVMLLKVGKEMKLARSLERFKCKEGEGGCRYCQPYEKILRGDAKFVGLDNYRQDVYILPDQDESGLPESTVL